MRIPKTANLALSSMVVTIALAQGGSQAGVLDHLRGETPPPSLTRVARMIDGIQEDILDQGTVVIKKPDIWSQARMTMFRKEFEDTMSPEVATFQAKINAQIARSDTAQLQSETSLAGVLNPFAKGTNPTAITDNTSLKSSLQTVAGLTVNSETGQIQGLPTLPTSFSTPPGASSFSLLNQAVTGSATGDPNRTLTMPFGLEPNINLDQKADYINHLHRIRRVNLGDDNADSAGYGLYLMRLPISIQPGDKTKKGWGATVSMTMRHDFGPKFLPLTYRNLVINDLVDILGPNVYELIRSGKAYEHNKAVSDYVKLKQKFLVPGPYRGYLRERDVSKDSNELKDSIELNNVRGLGELVKATGLSQPVSRSGGRVYAIAPSDVDRVFTGENLLILSFAAQQALDLGNSGFPLTKRVRSTDVRSFLRHELESAYDLMEGRCRDQPPLLEDVPYIEDLTNKVYCRKYEGPKRAPGAAEGENEFSILYESFANRLPGNLQVNPIGVLAWGVAVEAGLLNRQLQEDMKATKGADGYACPAEVDGMAFYTPNPGPEVVTAFQEYVKVRWPMITFGLEPVTDQQNIQDAFTRRRDLQLAVAFALSSGRISFRQAINFNRQLQYEAQTIALNQTVSSFAHGNDTFGWRFTPRYQTPPVEGNVRAVTNLLTGGGPGPNYEIKNSKIEPGMRELTAVVVMPSFLHGMRLDVSGDWFRLHDPDERKLHTARSIELGRRINEAREALEVACKCGLYRAEDIERLRVKLHQLEVMLPLQTQFVNVPYENTLGGFALFTQGTTALVPELSGYEGVDYLDTTRANDIIIYGKHFSIYENAVVVGGQALLREGSTSTVVRPNPAPGAGNPAFVANTLTQFQNSHGDLIVLDSAGAVTGIKDVGTFDILSREVIRVHIPAGVSTSRREDDSEVVELYVSTPNGISNRLQIPVLSQAAPAPAVATGTFFTFTTPTLPVQASGPLDAAEKVVVVDGYTIADGTRLVVQATGFSPLPPSIDVEVTFPLGSTPAATTGPLRIKAIPREGDAFVARQAQLQPFVDQLFGLIGKVTPAELTTRSVVVIPAGDDRAFPVTNPGLKLAFAVTVPTAARGAAGTPSTAVASATPKRDPVVRRTGLAQAPAPGTVPPGSLPPLPPGFDNAQGTAPIVTPAAGGAGPVRINAPAPTPAAPSPTVIMIPPPPQPPSSINVNVPITNTPPAKKHAGLFRRQATGPATPATAPPVRGPLRERLLGRP